MKKLSKIKQAITEWSQPQYELTCRSLAKKPSGIDKFNYAMQYVRNSIISRKLFDLDISLLLVSAIALISYFAFLLFGISILKTISNPFCLQIFNLFLVWVSCQILLTWPIYLITRKIRRLRHYIGLQPYIVTKTLIIIISVFIVFLVIVIVLFFADLGM